MNFNFWYLMFLATLGSIAGLVGGTIFLIRKDWAKTLSKYAVSFAAGVLISVSLIHLIPEAHHEAGESVFLIALTAFVGSFFFEQFFAQLHHHDDKEHTQQKSSVPLVLFGDTIHNFIDGVAIAASYMVNPIAGLVVALATFFHETPHEIGDFGVLLKRGWNEKKTFLANLVSALATFPGAILTYMFADQVEGMVGILLAISAGVFLYLGASDFLPEVGEGKRKEAIKELFLFALGVAIMILLGIVSGHEH